MKSKKGKGGLANHTGTALKAMVRAVVYLLGAGATEGELIRQGREGGTLLRDLGNVIYELSEKARGKYWRLVTDFSLQPKHQDIELLISLLEFAIPPLEDISKELKQLYRECLIQKITNQNVFPAMACSLLRVHRHYGQSMGDEGEQLLGILTTNNDCLIEKACCDKMAFGGLNCGVGFSSDCYQMRDNIPPILKLHGSFNWRVADDKLTISDHFEAEKDSELSGWIPPSVFKKPNLEKPVFREIWTKAKNLLDKCNVLRVIGCSLRTEDLQLLSLLFSSQIESAKQCGRAFNIELILREASAIGNEYQPGIITRLGFLTGFKRLSELDVYSPEYDPLKETNPYYYWITRMIRSVAIRNPAIAEDTFINSALFGGS